MGVGSRFRGGRMPVGSRFAGMTWGVGIRETGRVAPVLWAFGAPDWIPAYAGMTTQDGGRGWGAPRRPI